MTEDDPQGLDGYRDKLVRRKQEWAADGRLLTEAPSPERSTDRLPPGQRQVENWPVLDLGVKPSIAAEDWKLTVDGAVEHPIVWDWKNFTSLPQVKMTSDIHCVTGWSRFDNNWTGVHVSELIEAVKPTADAMHCVFHAHDGYTTNVRMDRFADVDVLLAHSWEGKPLSQDHGGPVRVVIPKWYFWKSAKWVRRIEFRADDKPGFWEVRGYHNEGDPWMEDRYG